MLWIKDPGNCKVISKIKNCNKIRGNNFWKVKLSQAFNKNTTIKPE